VTINDTGNASLESTDSNENEEVGSDERLDGHTVKRIWSCSKLDRSKLRDIWIDCDHDRSGCLDVGAFVKGMWCIDEELRRTRLAVPSSVVLSKRQPRTINSNLAPR